MDGHHFKYIKKLEKKRGINKNAITWANHYDWPIKSSHFSFHWLFCIFTGSNSISSCERAVFHPKY